MPRMSGKKAKLALEICIDRDGVLCVDCGKRPAREVHHVDENEENNPPDGSNWWGLCHSCHRKMHPRGPNKPTLTPSERMTLLESESESVRESMPEEAKAQTLEMAKNSVCYPMFVEWLGGIIDEMGIISLADVKNGGAYKVGCSQQAIQRYSDALCSFTAPYEYFVNEEGKRFIRRRQTKPVILPLKVASMNRDNDA